MSLRRSTRLLEKRRKLEGDGDENEVPAKVTKPDKIEIADDVLQKFLEWILLPNLPNLITVNRRFWLYSDKSLETRKHTITMALYPQRLDVWRMISNAYSKRLPIAEVEPPQNFELKYLKLHFEDMNIEEEDGDDVMSFLRISKKLFVGAHFWYSQEYSGCNEAVVLKLLDIFDKCSLITISARESWCLWSEGFFTRTALLNCESLKLFELGSASFDLNSLVEWLHTPPESDANAKRQAFIAIGFDHQRQLLSLIKKRFSEDDTKHRFCTRFIIYEEDIRMENQRTGEILFMRIGNYMDLIRCGKDEEDSVTFEEIDRDEHPDIQAWKE